MRPVADEIAAAVDLLDPELFDPRERRLQRRQVCVDVGDHRNPLAHRRERKQLRRPAQVARRPRGGRNTDADPADVGVIAAQKRGDRLRMHEYQFCLVSHKLLTASRC